MKKTALFLVAIMLMAVLSACGGNKTGGATNSGQPAGSGKDNASQGQSGSTVKKKVKIFNFKVEIVEPLQKLKQVYESSHPDIELDIETVGGSGDYFAALKPKFAAGDEPDIFFNPGYSKLDLWVEYLEDLSDQPWVEDVIQGTKTPITKDGKLYGMPLNIEGQGIIYNKDLFAQAGIDKIPGTLAELEQAAQALQAQGIIPFSNGYQEWWLLGGYMNVAMALQSDPDQFIADAKSGAADFKSNYGFNEMLNAIDVTLKYGNPNPLTTDYNTNVTMFATGEAAMMFQGNWTQTLIDEVSPGLNIGIMPVPTTNEGESVILGFPPSNWVINKNSAVLDEAKQFLNWLAASQEGHDFMIKDSLFIPAFTTIEFDPEALGLIAADIQQYGQEDKLMPIHAEKMPEGTAQEFANALQAYMAGKLTRDQVLEQIGQVIVNLNKAP